MRQFSMLIKPASSLCNMRCRYCFYHDVASHREAYSHGVMKERTAQAVIDRAFEHVGAGPAEITFGFQGGEPAVAGLDFFRAFTAYVREKQPAGVRVRYALQTNGTLLTDEWAAFLSEHDFLVGVSLDGSREVHDFLRLDKDGRGTYAAVTRGIRRLDAHGAAYNILAVVTRQMARHPRQVYAALTRAGYRYLQFIPCLRPLEGGDRQPFDLTPRDYAAFLKQTFVLWKADWERGQPVSVRLFDNLVGMLRGDPPGQCGLLGRCAMQMVVEADGSVYPCDFYVLDEYRCGSVLTDSFAAMEASGPAQAFLSAPTPLHPLCGDCRAFPLCGGGCRRTREFFAAEDGYCPYQDFLYACADDLASLARRL